MQLVRYDYPPVSFGSAWPSESPDASPFRRFGSLFDEFFGQGLPAAGPALDMYEAEDAYHVRAELPGVKKGDLDIELENSILTIRGSKQAEGDDQREEFSFNRAMSVPEGVDADKVKAKLEDGVLDVELPKAEERKPRQIKIK